METVTQVKKETLLTVMRRIGAICDKQRIRNPDQRIGILMDVEFSGVDMEALAAADDSTFGHDVAGIVRHFNRETRELEGGFLPRVGMAQSAAKTFQSGDKVIVRDGTPRPPDRHHKKLARYRSRNFNGTVLKDEAEYGRPDHYHVRNDDATRPGLIVFTHSGIPASHLTLVKRTGIPEAV